MWRQRCSCTCPGKPVDHFLRCHGLMKTLTGDSRRLHARCPPRRQTGETCLEGEGNEHATPDTHASDSQNPVKLASFAGSFDMAPMIQYAVVCHIASSMPQMMYRNTRPTYGLS